MAAMVEAVKAAANNSLDDSIVCYTPTMTTTNGIWQGDNPLDYFSSLFILQAEYYWGPSVLGKSDKFVSTIFPLGSMMVVETMANVGLFYFIFLVGLEMDISVIPCMGKRAVVIAIASMILPFLIGAAFSFLLHKREQPMNQGTFILFLSIALSITAFLVLTVY